MDLLERMKQLKKEQQKQQDKQQKQLDEQQEQQDNIIEEIPDLTKRSRKIVPSPKGKKVQSLKNAFDTLSKNPEAYTSEFSRSLEQITDKLAKFDGLEKEIMNLKKSLIKVQEIAILLFEKAFDLEEGETILEENIEYERGKTKEENKAKSEKLNRIIKFVNSIKKNKESNKE